MSEQKASFSRRFRQCISYRSVGFSSAWDHYFRTDFILDLFKEPALRLAIQLGLREENSLFWTGNPARLDRLGCWSDHPDSSWLFVQIFARESIYFTTEKVLDKVPFLNAVYRSVKQIVETFGRENRAVFKEVCLVEYPRKGCYALGFITADASSHVQEKVGDHMIYVFVPTTPNPTSGFLLLVPREEIYKLDVSVGDGMKMLISGGAVVPPANPQ